jgi:hypothetical protein
MKSEEVEAVGFSTNPPTEIDQAVGVEFDPPIPDAEIPAAADRENATTSRSTNSLLTE